ncbi:MAG: hypothetical protein HMLIMOIP_000458 [Candidatus Nitrosomirales archaeon]|jgi:hypothetical protein
MHKLPFLFVFLSGLMSIVFSVMQSSVQNSYAQESGLTVEIIRCCDSEGRPEVNVKTFVVGDRLILSGNSLPNDALGVELFNSKSVRVLVTQIDVEANGDFRKELLRWPVPSQDYPYGTYSLVIRSSLSEERRVTEALRFDPIPGLEDNVGLDLATQISVPPVIGINESTRILVQVTINGVLVKGDAKETLADSHIHFPDGSIKPIENFTVLEDGVYFTDFRSSMLGDHTIHVEAFQQGLIANSVSVVLVQEGSVSSLSKVVSELNTNVNALRQETVEKTGELTSSVSRIESASGQVTSLLLPIIGMIAIIVALQATMLARKK